MLESVSAFHLTELAPATLVIIIISVVVSLYAYFGNSNLFELLILHPASIGEKKRWYTFISNGFLHGDIIHLVINMLSLYLFGSKLEFYLGLGRYILIFLVAVILSNLLMYLRYRNDRKFYTLGSSGPIVAFIVLYILLVSSQHLRLLFLPFTVSPILFAVLYLGYSYYLIQSRSDNVHHEATFAGALTGIVFALIVHPQLWRDYLNIL